MPEIEVKLESNMDDILDALGEQLGQGAIAIGMAGESNAKYEKNKNMNNIRDIQCRIME